MIQNPGGNWQYTVKPNENITVRINAVQTSAFCSAASDGSPCVAISKLPTCYSVPITDPVGSEQNFVFYGSFASGVPMTAHYELYLQGDAGGPEYQGPWLLQTNLAGSIQVVFEVQA